MILRANSEMPLLGPSALLFVMGKTLLEHALSAAEGTIAVVAEQKDVCKLLDEMKARYAIMPAAAPQHAPAVELAATPWELLTLSEQLLANLKTRIDGTVENGAVLKGPVAVGTGSVVKSGSYIEGPVFIGDNCVIGPNCYIRGSTSMGNACKVGNAVEVKNCVLQNNVSLGHLSYIGDSVLGRNVNIGAGTITANLRHDNKNVCILVNGKKQDTGRRKFGCVIGNNVHTGIHTAICPGRFVEKDTLPGEVVM